MKSAADLLSEVGSEHVAGQCPGPRRLGHPVHVQRVPHALVVHEEVVHDHSLRQEAGQCKKTRRRKEEDEEEEGEIDERVRDKRQKERQARNSDSLFDRWKDRVGC